MVASSSRPAPDSKRFDVELTVVSLTNLRLSAEEETLVSVDVKWKGPKSALGSRFRKSQKKDNTSAEVVTGGGAVVWGGCVSKFKHQCLLLGAKSQGYEEVAYQPWDVNFVILKAAASAPEKTSALGKASLNLSEYGSGLRNPWTTIQVEMEGKGVDAIAELKVRQGDWQVKMRRFCLVFTVLHASKTWFWGWTDLQRKLLSARFTV